MRKGNVEIPTEHQGQATLFYWAEVMGDVHPELKMMLAIPNGTNKSIQSAVMFSAKGLKKGVPDICLPVSNGRYHSLWIELKRRKGGRVTAEQRQWIEALNSWGSLAVVCRGWEEARDVIADYLGISE